MTINHAIKIKMSFAFIRAKIKLYTHWRYNKGEEGKGKKRMIMDFSYTLVQLR